ncbi:MAG TPA: hypothetical protein VLD40_05795 [Dissulfurispiraceae bacterium]|nr:hypothetical protein [Dissulfurispiraceae bacterium]
MLPATTENLDETVRACRRMATKAALKSAFAGALPIPLVDVAIDLKILARLLSEVNERFGLSQGQMSHYHEELRLGLFDLIKRTGAKFAGRYITLAVLMPVLRRMGLRVTARQTAKYVPVIGTGLTMAVSFSAMKFVANLHIRECAEIVRQAHARGVGSIREES